ncbi:MAG: histidinol-phosphatase [Gemmataceae bacterium]|nr:histidinol-phosphatase [Gemmataceae bacterium]
MNSDWKSRYLLGIQAAREASQLAHGYFETALQVEWKKDESPVTRADREAEQKLRQTLQHHFPKDGFLGEEFGDFSGESGYRWIIDPIDGTRNFVRGIPLWGTLLGLEYRGEMIAGIVEAPALRQSWRALRGDGAFHNDKPIQVSKVNQLKEAQVFYSSIAWFTRANKQKEFLQLASSVGRQRGFGDFYGFVLVAQGAGEIMVEYGVHAWDIAALIPILEEAGGKLTNWNGLQSIHSADVLATNGLLHQPTLDILGGA